MAFLVPKSVTQTHGAFFVRFFTARERRDAMEATIQTIMEAALQQGIWAALYIYGNPAQRKNSKKVRKEV